MVHRWPAALVRTTFLDFFRSNGYTHVPSCSIRPPHGDTSLLFVNAGMNQFKPIFLNQNPLPEGLVGLKSAVNSQKCLRVGGKHNDLSHVGLDGTHHTFFEMLGHWSFCGHLSKAETVQHAWWLLTDVYGIPTERLFVTCFEGNNQVPKDTEAAEIWSRTIGVPEEKISFHPAAENFWEMGTTGPCGPCTEIHYSAANPPTLETSQELWNLVFIQYNRLESGELEKLPAFHVDTGLGFERLTAVLQGASSNYETDLFVPIMQELNYHLPYLPEYRNRYRINDVDKIDQSYRLLADHARSITVAISDGVQPAHRDEGYVVKSLIYRAVNRLLKIGGSPEVLGSLCRVAADILSPTFPEIGRNLDETISIVDSVAKKSQNTLQRGRKHFKKWIYPRMLDERRMVLNSEELRSLRSRGLPEDIISDIASDKGVTVALEQ